MSIECFPRPNSTVDTIILTIKEGALYVLTIRRVQDPYKGSWSLVGGFVDIEQDKDLLATAKRKLFEKTGVKTPYLEQYITVGNNDRDPRGWTTTTIYFALVSFESVKLKADYASSELKWAKIQSGKVADKLAFDHNLLLSGCLDRLKSKVMYTTLPMFLLPKEFTLGELKSTYEIILGKSIERKSLYRRVLDANILEKTGETRQSGRRPAEIYRLKDRRQPYFFSRSMGGI